LKITLNLTHELHLLLQHNAANTGGVLAQFFAPLFFAKNATALAVRVICLVI